MCPELQYTKERNENINQVKTQLVTYEPNCVLNSNIQRTGVLIDNFEKNPKRYQDFDLRA